MPKIVAHINFALNQPRRIYSARNTPYVDIVYIKFATHNYIYIPSNIDVIARKIIVEDSPIYRDNICAQLAIISRLYDYANNTSYCSKIIIPASFIQSCNMTSLYIFAQQCCENTSD